MVGRARLVAPPPPIRTEWPWHRLKTGEIRASAILTAGRRLDARTFLSTGYGIRLAIQGRSSAWLTLNDLADIVQIPRTKGTLVDPKYGTPFLIANQMFEIRPQVRKWLALGKIPHGQSLFAPAGTIIARRSADVGRSTVTCKHHEGHLISDHFFRIEPRNPTDKGWLYAFIKSSRGRAMMVGDQYGHIIQHIEFGHLRKVPLPTISQTEAGSFLQRLQQIVDLRNRSHERTLQAEQVFEEVIGPLPPVPTSDGFVVRVNDVFKGRRRFDASGHTPAVRAIKAHLAQHGSGFTKIAAAGYDVWLPNRFRRIPATEGVALVESASLLEINPENTKRIAETNFGDQYAGRVKTDWVLMARSGQVYGIIGTAVLATTALLDDVISDDVIRIAPKGKCAYAPGYLTVALSHPRLGLPLVKALAYGSSIPHIDPADLAAHEIVRLPAECEAKIDSLAKEAAADRSEADSIERAMAHDADQIIDDFIAGNRKLVS